MPLKRLYEGDPEAGLEPPKDPPPLPAPPNLTKFAARYYDADDGLRDAVNVALQLRQPLLLTGKPGTGKTMLAYSLAWELGLGTPLKFETKTASEARDLFYTYDSLARFHAAHAQSNGGKGPASDRIRGLHYLRLRALGEAIARSLPAKELREIFEVDDLSLVLPDFAGEHRPRRSVVLIDEIDKAPRDFPNDILNEIEHLYFRIPELQIESVPARGSRGEKSEEELEPVIVITSNSEKALPGAFLRRCIFYHISPPDKQRLATIVRTQLAHLGEIDDTFLDRALEFYLHLQKARLDRPPATAEFLNWMVALLRLRPGEDNPLAAPKSEIEATLSCLAKFESDLKKAHNEFTRFKF